MVDPARTTNAARSYGYKRLIYEPLLGGGALTAGSVPIILQIGSLWFGVISAAMTVLFIAWGCAAPDERGSRRCCGHGDSGS